MKHKVFWKLLSLKKSSQVPSQNSTTDKIQSDPQILLLGNYLSFIILVYLISCLCHEVTQSVWSWCIIWCFAHVRVFFFFFALSLTSLVPSRSQKQWACLMYFQNGMAPSTMVQLFSKKTWDKAKNRQCTVQIEALWSSHVTLLWKNGVQYQEEEIWFCFPLATLIYHPFSAGNFG